MATPLGHSTRPCGPPPSNGHPSYAPTYPRTTHSHRHLTTTCHRRSSPFATSPPSLSRSRPPCHRRGCHSSSPWSSRAPVVRSYVPVPLGASLDSVRSCRRNTTSAFEIMPRGRIPRAHSSPIHPPTTTPPAPHRTRSTGSHCLHETTTFSTTSSSTSPLVWYVVTRSLDGYRGSIWLLSPGSMVFYGGNTNTTSVVSRGRRS